MAIKSILNILLGPRWFNLSFWTVANTNKSIGYSRRLRILDEFSDTWERLTTPKQKTDSNSSFLECRSPLKKKMFFGKLITCSNSTLETLDKRLKYVPSHKKTTLFWCLNSYFWTYFTSSPKVCIVDFEQVNVCWVLLIKSFYNLVSWVQLGLQLNNWRART